jgi:hypothetical protein
MCLLKQPFLIRRTEIWVNIKVPIFHSYLVIPWSRVFLDKLTGFKLVNKFAAFYGTRGFITAVTSARHLSLSWGSTIQSIRPHSTSWRAILILPSHLRLGLPRGLFPSGFPQHAPVYASPLPQTRDMPRPSHSSDFTTQTILGEE